MDIKEFYEKHDYNEMMELLKNSKLCSWQKEIIYKRYVDLITQINIEYNYMELGSV